MLLMIVVGDHSLKPDDEIERITPPKSTKEFHIESDAIIQEEVS